MVEDGPHVEKLEAHRRDDGEVHGREAERDAGLLGLGPLLQSASRTL
jgi:hypothetical protein